MRKNAVAVVTGASSGLGKETARLLAEEGVTVFALARNIEKASLPDSVIKVPLDIRNLESIDQAFAAIDAQAPQIDILVNCAGVGLVKPLEEITRDEIMNVLGVNLKGNIYIAQEVYKRMLPHQAGHIVNVSSTSGTRSRELETIYCASKWGLRGFTDCLRFEAMKHKIRVTGFYPGGMKSENFWKISPGKDLSGYIDPAIIAEQIVHILKTDVSFNPSEVILERFAA